MKKVLVIGSGGAGKSTFSRSLGELTGIEVIHLDKLYWHPDWNEPQKPIGEKSSKRNSKKTLGLWTATTAALWKCV